MGFCDLFCILGILVSYYYSAYSVIWIELCLLRAIDKTLVFPCQVDQGSILQNTPIRSAEVTISVYLIIIFLN